MATGRDPLSGEVGDPPRPAPGWPHSGEDSPAPAGRVARLRWRLYRWLELGSAGDPQGRWFDRLLIALVLAAVALVALETVPSLASEWDDTFALAELVIGTTFLAEYLARLWVANLHPPYRKDTPLMARLRYALQPAAIVDLLAVLPFVLGILLVPTDFKVMVILRLARFFKLARYSPALRSLTNALLSERHAIGASLIIIFGVVMLAATAMYMVERQVQPQAFGTIPDAVWWAMTTVTTVGYGDVVPVTPAGKVLGGLVMLLGYGLLALPVGIVATAFAREIHSRDFAVTWGMVARVPLFQDLRAADIAEIARLLRGRSVKAGQVISQRGEPASSMFFIASGLVEMTIGQARVHLEEGGFFGEMAVLGERRRSATVMATSDAQLMVLDSQDLHALLIRKPDLARRILDEMRRRRDLPRGDIVEEEIAEAAEVEPVGEPADETEDALASDGEGLSDMRPDTEVLPDLFSGLPDAQDRDPDGDGGAKDGSPGARPDKA
nr:cyclic nucleotide-gated ion channel [Stappia sp. WLB 29]